MKKVIILGSTGSIGTQALEVISSFPDKFTVEALCAQSHWQLLAEQIRRFKPRYAALQNPEAVKALRNELKDFPVNILSGDSGIKGLTALDYDIAIVALVGIAGLIPSLEVLKHGRTLALANKEALVVGGSLMLETAVKHKAVILPVDSEHSAIFQALQGENPKTIKTIYLTSSGGAGLGKSLQELRHFSVAQALAHPTWSMGSKITIDSATMMNKGFEVIEAHYLFKVPAEKISVIIHPQSIIHSMVEFHDGSIMAQMSPPDMRLPIQYALGYPQRLPHTWQTLDFSNLKLSFEPPDIKKFPALTLAYQAIKTGGTLPAVLNAANEIAVSAFLNQDITFLQIPAIIDKIMCKHDIISRPRMADLIQADKWARSQTLEVIFKTPGRKGK